MLFRIKDTENTESFIGNELPEKALPQIKF